MSETKTTKKVNKFTKALDFNLGKLKAERIRLDVLGKRDNKDSMQYRGALKSVANLEKKVNSLYQIVSGQQEYIPFRRTGNWSNPLNKLGIGPYSNQPVFNTFALGSKELESRYPDLFKEKGNWKGKKTNQKVKTFDKPPGLEIKNKGSSSEVNNEQGNGDVQIETNTTPLIKPVNEHLVPYTPHPSKTKANRLRIPTANWNAYVEPHQVDNKNLKIGRA